ncbi:expressed unknown protein [Seminavis robusta]|uniref:Uncharacterized protein n=1 Tax=Seminavis robusta TaxID=568900 RepID=A0A9N8HPJ0_9STRA|nr:expressed unknown protein [Seminavis robusta]|eukprot:Sro1095_g240650.1 n/a (906) ;mRNA; r:9146-12222
MRTAGPATPEVGPGLAMGSHGKRRRRIKKKSFVRGLDQGSQNKNNNHSDNDDDIFDFMDDGPPVAKTKVNVVSTVKKAEKKDAVKANKRAELLAILEDSSDDEDIEEPSGIRRPILQKASVLKPQRAPTQPQSNKQRPNSASKGRGVERRLSFSADTKGPAESKRKLQNENNTPALACTTDTSSAKRPLIPALQRPALKKSIAAKGEARKAARKGFTQTSKRTPRQQGNKSSSSNNNTKTTSTTKQPGNTAAASGSGKSNAVSSSTGSGKSNVAATSTGSGKSNAAATGSGKSNSAVSQPTKSLVRPRTNRFVIAFDSRFLDTLEGRQTAMELIEENHNFLDSLASKGASPYLLASSDPTATAAQILEQDDCIEPAWITPSNKNNVRVPKQLLASNSWEHFGQIVDAIIEQDSKAATASGASMKNRQALLDVMIVTNDVSLFCDVSEGGHKRALSRFCDRAEIFFREGAIRTIRIVVANTGRIAIALPKEKIGSSPKSEAEQNAISFDVDDVDDVDGDDDQDNDELGSQQQEPQQLTDLEQRAAEYQARRTHELSMAGCIRAMESLLNKRSEIDYEKLKVGSNNKKPVLPVDIAVSTIDATTSTRLAFKTLQRSCLRDIVDSTMAITLSNSASSAPKTRIHLALPETIDGMQSSVALEVTHKLIPFPLDRPSVTGGFFHDLQELCSSELSLVQLIPLALVDASLLFGVPMHVRAGTEDDIDRYHEVCELVKNLFSYMQKRQVAMLLRSSGPPESNAPGIFHNPQRGQLFLLAAEEPVGSNAKPSTGSLFRYASADELLLETQKPLDTSLVLPDEVRAQYESYVENALDMLDCCAVNPLYLEASRSPPLRKKRRVSIEEPPAEKTTLSVAEADKIWNDSTGVGALKSPSDDDDEKKNAANVSPAST